MSLELFGELLDKGLAVTLAILWSLWIMKVHIPSLQKGWTEALTRFEARCAECKISHENEIKRIIELFAGEDERHP